MKEPKLSVIIAVYNTEKYVEKCLDSLLSQTYSNIELVVVNDCSTDGSLKILKKYAKKYDNIILIDNKQNKGLSYSRNVGLENASGEYTGYIDSDDYIDPNYYEKYTDVFFNDTFLYHEEEFLYQRIINDHLISIYNPDLEVFHKEGASLNSKYKNEYQKLIFKNEEILKSLLLLEQQMNLYESRGLR